MAAAGRLGVEVTAASEQASTLTRRNPAGLLALPFARPELAVRKAVEFAARNPVAAVVGVDDATCLLAAEIAAALSLPHNPPEAVVAARNKLRAREVCRAAGLPVPWFRRFSIEEDPE